MRLTDAQRTEILRTAEEEFGADVRVTLFGSRIDDNARGGDIDLMITTTLEGAPARRAKLRFLARAKQRIGDRRIDVVPQTPSSAEHAIYRAAATIGVDIR